MAHKFYKPVKRVTKKGVRALKLIWAKIFFERYLKNDTPILVYQMGKVASSSVAHSLKNHYSGVVLHAHYFNTKHKDWRVRRLYHWVMKGAGPLNVISLTREPIGRNVSGFFQIFEKITGVPYHKANFSLEELKTIFLKRFAKGQPSRWFDNHIMKNFGIDVYANPFPKYGYATYKKKNIRLLVMRSELNDNMKVKAITDFLNLNEFKLVNRNISAQKKYASAYEEFRRNVKLPLDYINIVCKSKYFNHFYDQDTINSVKQKWCEPN
jgi:hypothetical protein